MQIQNLRVSSSGKYLASLFLSKVIFPLFPGIVLVSSSPIYSSVLVSWSQFLMFVVQSNQNDFGLRQFNIVCLIKYASSVTRNCIQKSHNQGVKQSWIYFWVENEGYHCLSFGMHNRVSCYNKFSRIIAICMLVLELSAKSHDLGG